MIRARGLSLVALTLLAFAAAPGVARAEDEAETKAKEALAAKKLADLLDHLKSEDATVRLAALYDAKDVQDPKVTTALAHALSDPDADARSAAIDALAARTDKDARKQAATALAARLPRYVNAPALQAEQLSTLKALHDLAQPSTVKALLDSLDKDDQEPKVLAATLHAIGNLPTAEAVDGLIAVLSRQRWGGGDGGWRRDAALALQYATGEKFGGDPDVWRKWWYDHRKSFDVQAAADRRAKAREEEAARDEKRKEQEKRRKEREDKKKDGSGTTPPEKPANPPKDGQGA